MDLTFANAPQEKAYFYKADQELIKKLKAQADLQMESQLRELHYMKCPKCGHDLHQTRLASLTVDRCTGCDGVFFDKEEWAAHFDDSATESNFIDTLHKLLAGDDKL